MPEVTFSFGENWQKFLDDVHPGALRVMTGYVTDWLGADLKGLDTIDIGSGQGLTSLVIHRAGADVTSLDVDAHSVAATRRVFEGAGKPASWRVIHGSILDPALVRDLGSFDLVISWGVLHHTGSVWRAIDHAASLVRPGGRLWIALYHRTPQSATSLRTKRLYNRTPRLLRPAFRGLYAAPRLAKLAAQRRLGEIARWREERGMHWWRDIEDWLGGLPYEPVGPGEVLARVRPCGFELVRLLDGGGEGGNDVYLFERHAETR